MSNIENNVVSMTFDNKEFETRLAGTIQSLDKLTETLKFTGAEKGVQNVSAAMGSFDASHMADAIDNISSKFSALGAIGFTVIQHLTDGVINFAKDAVDKVLGPIESGGKARAENIQQAQFQFRGLGIDVDKAMASSLAAVQGTSYGLDEAAKAAAQFGASGIGAGDQMTGALRAIAGSAAMTGSSFSEMAQIFTGSAGSGKVNNMDLEQFATRGLNAAAAVGKQIGKTEAQVHQMAAAGQLDFNTFAVAMDKAFGAHSQQANETYSGSLGNLHAAMSRLGASFFGDWLFQQRDLFNALTPVVDSLNKALQPIIKTLLHITGEGTKNIIDFLHNLKFDGITKDAYAIGLILGNLYDAFSRIRTVAENAFKAMFPGDALEGLLKFLQVIDDFAEKLKFGYLRALEFQRIFEGVFAIFDIAKTILKDVIGLFFDLLPPVNGVGGGVLEFAAKGGDALVALDKVVKSAAFLQFFKDLGDAIKHPVEWFKNLTDGTKSFTDQISGGAMSDAGESVNRLTQRFGELKDILIHVVDFWKNLWDRLQGVRDVLGDVGDYVKNWFKSLGKDVAAVLKPGDFDSAVDIVNVGLLGGIALILKKFLDGGLGNALSDGLIGKIKGAFGQLTTTLKSMQTEVKADTLIKIAEAVGILTVSIVALSLIDSAALTKALAAVGVAFGELFAVLVALDKVNISSSSVKLVAIGTTMILIAAAMDILAIAITALSKLDLGDLAKGLVGVGVGLGILLASLQLITDDSAGLITAGIAMSAISVGLLLLSEAVKSFATMSWGDMAKGMVGVGAGLLIMSLALEAIPPSSVLGGAGVILLAVGLNILFGAVKLFSTIGWAEMLKGMVGIGAALLIIAGAMQLMPLTIPITAAGMVILSVALSILAGVMKIFASMDLGEIGKGLLAMAGIMLILTVAMNAMTGAIPGAAATLIVAGALTILTKVIKDLGEMSIQDLATGLGGLAAVFILLGAAGYFLAPIVPSLLGLGAALTLIGIGFASFGIGAILVAKSFEIMGEAGEAGINAFINVAKRLMSLIPELIASVIHGLADSAGDILKSLDLLLRVATVFLSHVLDTLAELLPKIFMVVNEALTYVFKLMRDRIPDYIETAFEIITAFMQGIRDHIGEIIDLATEIIQNLVAGLIKDMPKLIQAAVDLLKSFTEEFNKHTDELVGVGLVLLTSILTGVADNIDKVIDAVGNIIVTFLTTIASNVNKVVTAGAQLLVWLLKGISDNIESVATAIAQLVTKFLDSVGTHSLEIINKGYEVLKSFLTGILDNLIDVTNAVGSLVTTFIKAIGDNIKQIVQAGSDALVGFLRGIGDNLHRVIDAGVDLIIHFIQGIADNTERLANAAGKAIVDFLNGLSDAIELYMPQIQTATARLGWAIIKGTVQGLEDNAHLVLDKLMSIAGSAWDNVLHFFHVKSPSGQFRWLGQMLMQGLAIGIGDDGDLASNSAVQAAEDIVRAFSETLAKTPDGLPGSSLSPVITPVLDLSKIRDGAQGINDLIGSPVITATASLGQANLISTSAQVEKASGDVSVPAGPTEIKFEQNNYSPEALSTSDIYRNTRSQIAMAKEELNIP